MDRSRPIRRRSWLEVKRHDVTTSVEWNIVMIESKRYEVRMRGPLACFTRPELKAERVSYEVITPSAARGAIEAVLWHKPMTWRIHAIKVLSDIRFTSFRRNEVTKRVPIQVGPSMPEYFADEDRSQRNTVALRDVDYIVTASFQFRKPADWAKDDNVRKYEEMFERRLEKGQCHHAPYLGCREFPARIDRARGDERPIAETRDLGIMLYDMDFSAGPPYRPQFFHARMERGVIDVDAGLTRLGGRS